MAEQDDKKEIFDLVDFKLKPISSAENIAPPFLINENAEDLLSLNVPLLSAQDAEKIADELDLDSAETIESDPIFDELSAPKLPAISKEDRARLQMQSPNRIHFYWSFKENPYKVLSRIFGDQTNYQLVAKLHNQTRDREEIFPIDSAGTAWFDVDADASYRVEIGFYAVSRPFVRLLFSNTLHTPRKNPSPRQDYSEYFAVNAAQFAKVLDSSGYSQDAHEVALAGDDIEAADRATETAFRQIFDQPETDFNTGDLNELRFVLLALASGHALEDLRGHVSPTLFDFLQKRRAELDSDKAFAALRENFGIGGEVEFDDYDEYGEYDRYIEDTNRAPVFGFSAVNFPRDLQLRPRRKKRPLTLPKFSPLSSLR